MIVAFWSLGKGNNGTTTNMIGTAIAALGQQSGKILLLESTFGKTTVQIALEHYRGNIVKEPFAYLDGEGLDYLIHRSKYDMLNRKTIHEGVVFVMENLGYVPTAIRKKQELYESEFSIQCKNILFHLELLADYVFVDCGSGCNTLNENILRIADIVIINIQQQAKELNQFFQTRVFFLDKAVYLIGSYHDDNPYNIIRMQRLYRIPHEELGIIPYNPEFDRIMKKGYVLQFFKHPKFYRNSVMNEQFIKEVSKSSAMILRKAAALAACDCINEKRLHTRS